MFKNVAAKFMVYAFDATTGLPKTGDGANITAYVSKDYGTVTVLADTSATEMDSTNAKGYYLFDAAQGETNADCLMVSGKSTTANIVIIGAPSVIYTRPTTGWLAPATAGRTLVVDASGLADANVVKLGPTGSGTAQTARDIGLSVLLSSGTGTGQLDFTSGVVKANATQWLGGTIPAVNVTGVPLVDLKYHLGTITTAATAGIPDVNAKNINNVSTSSVTTINANQGTTQPVNYTGTGASALVKSDMVDIAGAAVSTSTAQLGVNVVNAASVAWASGAITAAVIATGAVDADALATDAVTEIWAGSTAPTSATIASAVWDLDATAHQTQGTFGQAIGDPAADTDSIWALVNTNLDATVSSRSTLTGAQAATAVWTDTTASDFTTASSIGKCLYIANIAPGASGGHFISGSNAGTTTFGALTVTGATTFTGAISGTNASNDLRVNMVQVGGQQASASGAVDFDDLANIEVNIATIPGSVWDELHATHVNAGSFGLYLDAAITSRMATYAQPTGFLAATFPSGTIANTTNITAGSVSADVVSISGDSTAADNLESYLDGTLFMPVDAHKPVFFISGATLTVKKPDGTTTAYTRTLSTDAAAEPVIGSS